MNQWLLVSFAAICLIWNGTPLDGSSQDSQTDGAVEQVEPEPVEPQTPAMTRTDAATLPQLSKRSLSDKLGRLHPALVHFPIAYLFLLALVEWIIYRSQRIPPRIGLYMHGVFCLSVIPAAITGFMRAGSYPETAAVHQTIETHERLAIFVTLVVTLLFILRLVRPKHFTGRMQLAFALLLAIAALGIGVVGHLGGTISFGANFMPF